MVMHKQRQLDQLTDQEIISLILEQGRRDLQEVLYDRYAGKVFYKCLGVVGDRSTAQDLTHDVILKIFLKLASFQGKSDFSFWINAITYNHCMDYLKKKKRSFRNTIDLSRYAGGTNTDDGWDEAVQTELKLSQLEVLLTELKEEDRFMLLMRYQDSLPMKEISRILKISESAVKMRLRRSLDRLSDRLAQLQNDE